MKELNEENQIENTETVDAVNHKVQEQAIQPAPTQVVETVSAGQVVKTNAVAVSREVVQAKRTKNMVLPYLVALVVGKATMKDVTKALNMSEIELNKQISDNFGLILRELGDVGKKLEGAVGYFAMMEEKPERREVLMDMIKEVIEKSYVSLNQMAAKG